MAGAAASAFVAGASFGDLPVAGASFLASVFFASSAVSGSVGTDSVTAGFFSAGSVEDVSGAFVSVSSTTGFSLQDDFVLGQWFLR